MKKPQRPKQKRLFPKLSTTISPYTQKRIEEKQKELAETIPVMVRRRDDPNTVPVGAVIDYWALFEEHVNKHFPELVKKLPPMEPPKE